MLDTFFRAGGRNDPMTMCLRKEGVATRQYKLLPICSGQKAVRPRSIARVTRRATPTRPPPNQERRRSARVLARSCVPCSSFSSTQPVAYGLWCAVRRYSDAT
eukprot:3579098-Prymnesium_polylepis.1